MLGFGSITVLGEVLRQRMRRRVVCEMGSNGKESLRRIAIPQGEMRHTKQEAVVCEASTAGSGAMEVGKTVFDEYVDVVGDIWNILGVWCGCAIFVNWARKRQIELNDEQPQTVKEIQHKWKSLKKPPTAIRCTKCEFEIYPAKPIEVEDLPFNFKCPVCASPRDVIERVYSD